MSKSFSFLAFLCLLSFGVIIALIFKNPKSFKSLFLSVFSGIGSLFAVNIASYVTGVAIALNVYTLLFSAFLGLPGTIGLLLMNIILK